MKMMKAMLVVLPAYMLLSACGSKPDPSSIQRSATAPAVQSSTKVETTGTADVNTAAPSTVNVADLQAQQAALEAQKSDLQAKQQELTDQKASFAQPGDLQGVAFGDFMAGAQAVPAIDPAVIDDLIQAAMDMDVAAIQDAIDDLIAGVQDAIADIQAQIDDLAAQIQAAQA